MSMQQGLTIESVKVAAGVGGFWVNDQPAIQVGAEPDGFFFEGSPVSRGFNAIRQPSSAFCIVLTLSDGQVAYGDCTTVLNAGYADRPLPLRPESIATVRDRLAELYEGEQFAGFRDAAERLDRLDLGDTVDVPVAYGASQALLSAAALAARVPMAQCLIDEYGLAIPTGTPGIAGSCGGSWYVNVDKAIGRRIDMFPQAAIQRAEDVAALPEYVSWIRNRVAKYGGGDYLPDLHFDFHSALGRLWENDEDKVCDYLADIVERAGPHRVYFEDPLLSRCGDEAVERMAALRERLDRHGPNCGLIADEWANTPGRVHEFVARRCGHAIQIKMPDNGSMVRAIEAIQACQSGGVLAYLGGSCNETDISTRASVHVGLALNVWRLFTRPGLGFDEGLMVTSNEIARTLVRMR